MNIRDMMELSEVTDFIWKIKELLTKKYCDWRGKMSIDTEMKILLAEDSGITRTMEIKILKGLGFKNIIEAKDGEEAIQKLGEEEDVRLIISDWNMPNKNGYELLVWVRSDDKCKGIPFIMATAQAEKKQALKAEEAGASNLITKPFDVQELQKILEETFGVKREDEALDEERPPRMAESGKVRLNVAHIQITDHLTLGVLKHLIQTGKLNPKYFELETHCMPGWNPVQKALEKGEVDAAFILAPISMDLFSFDTPIKLVLFAHKNGSICVRRKDENREDLKKFFKDKSFCIPHILSIHHMLSNMFLRELGLNPGLVGQDNVDVFFEVVPPIKMPEFLAKNPEIGGFTVAEPLGTKAIASGSAELTFLSGQLWESHPCCVVAMRDDFIDAHTDAVQEFVTMLVKSGRFITQTPDKAAEIAVKFLDPEEKLGLQVPVLLKVLKEPQGIKTDDLFPVIEDLEKIQRYMVEEMGVGTLIDLEKFVDTRFAVTACGERKSGRNASRVHDLSKFVSGIVSQKENDHAKNNMLDKEGKYLTFDLADQGYGMGILMVKEIVGMMPIRTIPQTPPFFKGVINLRGKVIPVIDLRLKFGMEELDYTERTCIIVAEVGANGGSIKVGIVVDSVSEVLNVKAKEIEETPSFGVNIDTNMILGMATLDRGVKILLDTNQLFREKEVQMIENIV